MYLFLTYANGKSNPPLRQPTLAGDKTILANSDASHCYHNMSQPRVQKALGTAMKQFAKRKIYHD